VTDGRIRPILDFALALAHEAVDHLRSHQTLGKIIVSVPV